MKLLSQYLVLKILYLEEKTDIETSDNFFRKVVHYINQDLQKTIISTVSINDLFDKYN